MDTPIVGGTPEVEQAIREELAAFDAATGGGRARVSRIVVREVRKAAGRSRYDGLSTTIVLDVELPVTSTRTGYTIPLVLRHELCHVLNFRENLHHAREALYQRRTVDIPDYPCHSDECRQDEIFASYCELGPWVALAAAEGCPGDPTDLADKSAILQHLAEELWVGADEPLPTIPEPDWASVDAVEHGLLDFEVGELSVLTSPSLPEDLGLVSWNWQTGDAPMVFVDRRTGAPRDVPDEWFRRHEVAPPPPPIADPKLGASGFVGWEGGPRVGTVMAGLHGDSLRRVVWHDQDRWWLLGDGCPSPDVVPFATDRVFTLRIDGSRIGWGPVSAPEGR